MSQAKVDRYKEEKKNRQQIMKKEKREWMLTKVLGGVIAAAIVVWAGLSVYTTIRGTGQNENTTPTVVEEFTLDASALNDYIATLSAD